MHLEMLEGFKKIHQERISALSNFNSEVKRNNFPYPETNISMHTGENEKLLSHSLEPSPLRRHIFN